MRSSSGRSMGAPSARTIPAMPHISSNLSGLSFGRDLTGNTRAAHPSIAHRTRNRGFPLLLFFPFLFQQYSTDRHKDEVKDQNLGALTICRADVSLKYRVGKRQHGSEKQNR